MGPPFQGQDFKDFAAQSGFHHRKITRIKSTHSSPAEGQSWKTQLPCLLRQYRATPHGTNKHFPLEPPMNSGLPSIPRPNPLPIHNHLSSNDALGKQKMKTFADQRRHTQPSTLGPGDRVLVKQRKTNKLSIPFDPKPYTVVLKKGSLVTAERGGHHITRNSSFFKRLPAATVSPAGEKGKSLSTPNKSPSTPNQLVPGPPTPPAPNPPLTRRYPPRQTKAPERFQDCVLK